VRAAVATVAVALVVGGCGDDEERGFPTACNDSVPAIRDALAKAPEPVKLYDGTRLSTCVERARTGADIQTLGALYTATADALVAEMPRSDAAALRLGYLVGATHRGAAGTSGLHSELIRRLENSTALDGAPPARRAAYRRGYAAGRSGG
jgi:hypothetical protein